MTTGVLLEPGTLEKLYDPLWAEPTVEPHPSTPRVTVSSASLLTGLGGILERLRNLPQLVQVVSDLVGLTQAPRGARILQRIVNDLQEYTGWSDRALARHV